MGGQNQSIKKSKSLTGRLGVLRGRKRSSSDRNLYWLMHTTENSDFFSTDFARALIKKKGNFLHAEVSPLCRSSCFRSRGRKVPASLTTPIACMVPRSISFVTEDGLMSTEIVLT